MPRLPSSDDIVRVLLRRGFVLISQKGSHMKFRRIASNVFTVIVPAKRKEIPFGTLKSIIRQSGLDRADFD
jgi:predicted RNA binding protein YcfA (HicA-like mRNA interferase family)